MRGILIYISFLLIYWPVSGVAAEAPDELQQALRLTPDVTNGKQIYTLCATCHYRNGWGKPDGSFPVIAGQHRQVLIKQMADIRSGKRKNPTMFPFTDAATIGGVQAIADVTAYIANLPPEPSPGLGPGKLLGKGKSLYEKRCARCHGRQGAGNAEHFYPRLRGQHYAYLLRELRWIKSGFRHNSDPAMRAQLMELDDQDLVLLADYISRLPPQ